MKNLFIRGTKETPEIDFNGAGIFEMSGRSIPNDSDEFYRPVIDYIEDFIHDGKILIFDFKLDYYNTMSLRYLSKIFSLLQQMHDMGKEVMVNWNYRIKDEDLMEIGRDFKRIYKLKINMIHR